MRQIIERLNVIFRDVFDNHSIIIEEKTTAEDIDEWDSISHITLINAVEVEFKLKFKMGEISSMENVGDMIKIIEARGN